MILQAIITGFMLGIVSSWHCAGMCGPLALALPIHHLNNSKKLFSLLSYQLGRILTYSLFGLVFGLAGSRFSLAGLQQWFSIAAGLLILVFSSVYYIGKTTIRLPFIKRFHFFVQQLTSRLLRSAKSPFGFFLFGTANGLLPCGLVYLAIATSLTFSKVSLSVGFMAAFGAGTLPMMMLVSYSSRLLSLQARNIMRKAIPFFISAMALLLILRGLNLGIPFISPQLPDATAATVTCHQ